MTFNVVLKPDPESGYTVLFPDLPFGVTQGETVAECLEAAQDAITLVLDELIKRREPIPAQRRRRGQHIYAVTLPVLTIAKISRS